MTREQLQIKCQSNTRGHKPNVEARKRLVNETCRLIKEELDLVEFIERTAHTIETSVDELIEKHSKAPAYVARNQKQLERAYKHLEWLLAAIEPKKLVAAE